MITQAKRLIELAKFLKEKTEEFSPVFSTMLRV